MTMPLSALDLKRQRSLVIAHVVVTENYLDVHGARMPVEEG